MADSSLDSQISFVKERCDGVIISVTAENKHGKVIGSDGVSVYKLVEPVSKENVGRNFSHEQKFEVRTSFQSFFFHDSGYFFRFFYRTAERNHTIQVLQSEFFTDFLDRFQFETESSGVFRVIVTGSPSPAEKISRFFRFIFVAALQISVFAGLEIRETENDGTGCQSTAYFTDAFSQHIYHLFRTARFDKIQRVFVNESGPDKFFSHEADAVTGKRCIFACQVGIAEIHEDTCARRREIFSDSRCCALCLFVFFRLYKVGYNAVIDNAVLCVHSDVLSRFQNGSSFHAAALRSYYAGNTEFAGNDRCVAGHSACIGYDGNRFFHSRNPVGGRHCGDKYFPFFKLVDIGRIGNYMTFACRHSRTCRKTFHEYFMICCHGNICLRFFIFIFLGPYGFGTSLENPETILVIQCPFHIHIAAVMFFNFLRISSQCGNLLICHDLHFCPFFGNPSFFYVAAFFTDKLDGFFIDTAVTNGQCFLIYHKIIGCYGALYHIFAEPPGAFNHNGVISTGSKIYGKHNAGNFGVCHHLDSCGKRYVFMVEILFRTIINGTVRKGGRIAFLYLLDDHVTAGDIQIGILLARKGSIR